MQPNWVPKRDWILFRNRIAGWQEAYVGRLNEEYIELLSGDDSEADKFWELCRRMREDRRCAGVQVSMRGSDPLPIICRMINEGAMLSPSAISTSSATNCRRRWQELWGRIGTYKKKT